MPERFVGEPRHRRPRWPLRPPPVRAFHPRGHAEMLHAPREQAPANRLVGPQRKALAIPETWQRILDFMGQQHGSVTAGQVKEALGLRTDARHVLNRLVLKGLLQRVAPGVYTLG